MGAVATNKSVAGSARSDQFILILIMGYAVIWVVGLAGLYWPLVLALLFPTFIRTRLGGPAAAHAAIALVLTLSIFVGVGLFGWQVSRVVSAIGNGSIWLSMAALMALRPSVRSVTAGLSFLVVFQAALIFVAQIRYPSELPVPLLHDSMAWAPSGFEMMASNSLYFEGWLGGTAPRSSGIMGNPTWCGALGATGVLIALNRLRLDGLSATTLIIFVSGLYSLDLSLSRATIGALIIALLAGVITVVRGRSPELAGILWILLLCGILMAGVLATSEILAAAGRISDDRAGSLTTRSAVYAATWEGVKDHPFPLIGYGIKPQDDALVASIASHSTYLGLLYRAGVIGLGLFLGLLLLLFGRSLRQSNALGVAAVTFMAAWCVLEDLDGGHLLPLVSLLASMRPDSPEKPSGISDHPPRSTCSAV